jgi:hypothetical protein
MKYSTIARLLTVTSLASLTLSSCQSAQTPKAADPSPPPSNIVSSPPIAKPTPSPSASPKTQGQAPTGAPKPSEEPPINPFSETPTTPFKTATGNMGKSLNIYKADSQCNGLFPQKVEMPGAADANAAVGQVIANSNSPDFRVVNYRVNVENGTATVDLRLPADAKRPFSALSACEQLEFFGSMEKTLTSNPSLQVRSVRFRDGQKELQF